MKRLWLLSGVLSLGCFLFNGSFATRANAATIAPVQSKADPLNLPKAGLVDEAGSDAASAQFSASVLPNIISLVHSKLPEGVALKNTALGVDPSKLTLATTESVRIYFVGEGAGYHNTLGFNTLGNGVSTPSGGLASDAKIIFPDASSQVSSLGGSVANPTRTTSEPLLPGDFVDLPTMAAGSVLDFFLVSDGASGGKSVLTGTASRNSDHISHIVALTMPDSPYLILSFEDMVGGGDRDYNDVVFALELGKDTIQKLISAPEPSTWCILAAALGLTLFANRRSRTRAAHSNAI